MIESVDQVAKRRMVAAASFHFRPGSQPEVSAPTKDPAAGDTPVGAAVPDAAAALPRKIFPGIEESPLDGNESAGRPFGESRSLLATHLCAIATAGCKTSGESVQIVKRKFDKRGYQRRLMRKRRAAAKLAKASKESPSGE